MAIVAKEAGSNRKMWLFDSFEGMPEATSMDVGEKAGELANNRMSGGLIPVGTLVVSIDEVKTFLFKKLHLDEENIILVKG